MSRPFAKFVFYSLSKLGVTTKWKQTVWNEIRWRFNYSIINICYCHSHITLSGVFMTTEDIVQEVLNEHFLNCRDHIEDADHYLIRICNKWRSEPRESYTQ